MVWLYEGGLKSKRRRRKPLFPKEKPFIQTVTKKKTQMAEQYKKESRKYLEQLRNALYQSQILPKELLVMIFSLLGPKDIQNAAQVCKQWYFMIMIEIIIPVKIEYLNFSTFKPKRMSGLADWELHLTRLTNENKQFAIEPRIHKRKKHAPKILLREKVIWCLYWGLDVYLANLLSESPQLTVEILDGDPVNNLTLDIFGILPSILPVFEYLIDLTTYYGSVELAELMVETNLCCKSEMNPHWMCVLAERGDFSPIAKLFKKFRYNCSEMRGFPHVLVFCCKYNAPFSTISAILEHSEHVDVEHEVNSHPSALSLALKNNNIPVIKLLLANGANANGFDWYDSTKKQKPILMAKSLEAVELLIGRVDIDSDVEALIEALLKKEADASRKRRIEAILKRHKNEGKREKKRRKLNNDSQPVTGTKFQPIEID